MPDTAPSKPNVKVEAWTFDVGDAGKTIDAFADEVIHRVETSWDSGIDIVLLPEYLWAALEPLLPNKDADMEDIAKVVWQDLMPRLRQRLSRKGKHAILGTAPYLDPDSRHLYNRAIIFSDGRLLHQDKLFLTPWEHEFRAGRELYVFEMSGLRVAIVICLDIEVPELSSRLRGLNIDLLLVPSATETLYGSERVTRCASARAIELGCAVLVCPLVGKCDSSMVNVNLGKIALYLPALKAFEAYDRTEDTRLVHQGWHALRAEVPGAVIQEAHRRRKETNPSQLSVNLTPDEVRIDESARTPPTKKITRRERM
ncbi:nitrilase-related carbon-nitrogen hydrolase [Prosthecobacter fluviatilis]|uniref:Nitrilase-related carbon-nitrogen hydrolase n=1 Tax=Prosthecobacter fluviatilis TaxID=445931 RepID=A0ABW0KLF6_9BACT